MTLDALAHALNQRHGLNLVDFVGEWFWDRNPGAMHALSTYFPSAKGHLCLEHAKRNTEKRFSGGFKKLTNNFTEFSAFLPPPAFDIATHLFLASLSEQGQDITYLTTARKGGALLQPMTFGVLLEVKFPRVCSG